MNAVAIVADTCCFVAIVAAMNNVAMIDVAAIAIVAAMNAVATVC